MQCSALEESKTVETLLNALAILSLELKSLRSSSDYFQIVVELLVHIFPNNVPREKGGTTFGRVLSETSELTPPGVIQIGNNFFIKIRKKHSQLENANLKSALSFLLAYY
ncbi:hypothetical protein OUZ56_003151 [Daphnia magna]|uniref:Uncharacterized protein n=1 Tax=Daphnia magna TaxID=35525 RepID=A0ABR0A7W4_9CRUS|nr:hypothetical protein OUZ56_003151 [Daphnia magna]